MVDLTFLMKRRNESENTKKPANTIQVEAFAYVKYMVFAEHARKNCDPELADLFEKTAHVERFEHLAEEAELAGLIGSLPFR